VNLARTQEQLVFEVIANRFVQQAIQRAGLMSISRSMSIGLAISR